MESIKRFGLSVGLDFGVGIWFDVKYFKSLLIKLPCLVLRVSFDPKVDSGLNFYNGFID